MNGRRWNAAAAVVNGKIFCSGGSLENSVECYDPFSDVWTLICDMPQEIKGHGAVEINGNFIIIGGEDLNREKALKNVWALDTTDKNAMWIEKQPISIPRSSFSIAKIDDKIFVCRGKTEEEYEWRYLDEVEIFDEEVWRSGPKIPTNRMLAPAVVIPVEFARDLKEAANDLEDVTADSIQSESRRRSSRCSIQ